MNVLILSAAAKTPLVEAFKVAAGARGGRVLGCDLNPASPALRGCDGIVDLPASDAPDFAAALIEACRREAVALVVPTRDGELAALAGAAEGLRAVGTQALVSDPSALEICGDKARFADFCEAQGLAVPRRADPEDAASYPLFARPRRGAAGQGAGLIADQAAGLALDRDVTLFQEAIGAPEYSIDLLGDFAGRPLQAAARRRVRVVDGEAHHTRIEQQEAMTAQALRLAGALGLVGHAVLQAFLHPQRGVLWIEANPRFGGASILSIEAGLQSPARLLALIAGEEAARLPRPLRDGLTLMRYGAEIRIGPAPP